MPYETEFIFPLERWTSKEVLEKRLIGEVSVFPEKKRTQ